MKEKDFILSSEYIELVSLLKLLKIASTGGHAKMMIEEEEVLLNGNVETRKRAKLRKGDVITAAEWKINIR